MIDLRWGITPKEAASGRVIEICLDEIERTRPYFIGLIGGRYGWIPDLDDSNLNKRLLSRYPWIIENIKRAMSITEIEMRFGVLNNPGETNAFFYLRDLDSISKDNLDSKGSYSAACRDRLRNEIIDAAKAGFCHASSYNSLNNLGRKINNDLMKMINKEFPLRKIPTLLENIYFAQTQMLRNLTENYVEVETNLSFNLESALRNGEVIKITGPSGIGKSACIAHMLKASPRTVVADSLEYEIVHTFIGDNVVDRDTAMRMLILALSKNDPDIPISNIDDFNVSLDYEYILSSRSHKLPPIIWILDGIDKFSIFSDRDMGWINDYKKHLGGMILISNDESYGNGIQSDSPHLGKVNKFKMYPLSPHEVTKIINTYLHSHSKSLSFGQLASIANDPKMQIPSMLRIFLDELLQFGIFENLDIFIRSYLAASDRKGICELVLERMEKDFGSNLIRLIISTLRLFDRGVEEDIFTSELGLKEIDWIPIRDSLLGFCGSQNELLRLNDSDFIAAADTRYSLEESEKESLTNTALRILRQSLSVYLKRCRSLTSFIGQILYGPVGRIFLSDVHPADLDKLHECVAQIIKILIDNADYENIIKFIRQGYHFMLKPEDMSTLMSSGVLKSDKIDISSMIRYIDILLPTAYSYRLLFFKTLILNINDAEQKQKLEGKIRRMWLPSKFKKRALQSFSRQVQYNDKSILELLDSKIISSSEGVMAFFGKSIEILSINVASVLNDIISKCEMLLIDDSLETQEKSIISIAAAYAAIRKRQLYDALKYTVKINVDEIQYLIPYVYFIKTLVALKFFSTDSSSKNKSDAQEKISIFRNIAYKYKGTEIIDLMSLWIKELTLELKLKDPLDSIPVFNIPDVYLNVIAFGLHYDGAAASVKYLSMMLERGSISQQDKYLAAYFAGYRLEKSHNFNEAARYFNISADYYKKLGNNEPDISILLHLANVYRLNEQENDYVNIIHNLMCDTDLSKLNDNYIFCMFLELLRYARSLYINDEHASKHGMSPISILNFAQNNYETHICTHCIAMYTTMLDHDEFIIDEDSFDVILDHISEHSLYFYDEILDAVLDFMIYLGQHDNAIEIQKKWFGHCKRAVSETSQMKKHDYHKTQDFDYEIEDQQQGDPEDALEQAIYCDGIHGEVEYFFDIITDIENADDYVIKYVDGISEYVDEMEICEDRFISKLASTAFCIRPYMRRNKDIFMKMKSLLDKMSNLSFSILDGYSLLIGIAETMAFLGIDSGTLESVHMSLLPWLGQSDKALAIYDCRFSKKQSSAIEYIRALAYWQIGDEAKALDIISTEIHDIRFAELQALIACGNGLYSEAADILMESDKLLTTDKTPDECDYSEPVSKDKLLRILAYSYAERFQDAFDLIQDIHTSDDISICISKMKKTTEEYDDSILKIDNENYSLIPFSSEFLMLFYGNEWNNITLDSEKDEEDIENEIPGLPYIVSIFVQSLFYLLIGNITDAMGKYEEVSGYVKYILKMEHNYPGMFAVVLFFTEYAVYLFSQNKHQESFRHLETANSLLSKLKFRSKWAETRLKEAQNLIK